MNQCKAIPDYYRFYEHVNRNGLKYDIAIDNANITQLTYDDSVISGKLKQLTEQLIDRTLSPDTFYGHRNVLVDCKILNKADSENAKKLLKLNLLGVDWEKIKLFITIYQKFFLYEVLHDPLLILRTEDEFDSLLSDLGVNRDDLDWGRISTAENHDSVSLVYEGDHISPLFKSLHKKNVMEYWQKRKGQTSVSEKIEFICFPLKLHNNLDVVIYRREYWKINKNSPSGIERTEYAVTIPGVSIHELTIDNSHRDIQFEHTVIEKAFELLRQCDLIDQSICFRGHMRYKVADENLRNLISDLKHFYDEEFGLLSYKWKHFEEPNTEEKKRWKWILGEKIANKFFNQVEIIRYENRKKLRQCKNIVEYHKSLNMMCPQEFSSPVYGSWPYNDIFYDYVKERDDGKEERAREKKKETGRMNRAKKIGETKKELKDDIIKYEQYLRKRLDFQLERLPINFERVLNWVNNMLTKSWYR
jgi:hypothetical protein